MPLDIHVRVAGWLHIVMGGLAMVLLVVVGLVFGAFGAFGLSEGLVPGVAAWIAGFGLVLLLLFMALVAAEIVGGVLLLRGSAVGRVITMVFSAMSLLNFPIGTVIGAYSLWALLREMPVPTPRSTFTSTSTSTPTEPGYAHPG